MKESLLSIKDKVNWFVEKIFTAIDWIMESMYQWSLKNAKK